MTRPREHTRILAEFVAGLAPGALPASTSHAARRHLLDTLGAILSGTALPAGRFGRDEAAGTGGTGRATVVALPGTFPAALAAYANAMAAHADETDDSHAPSLTHPGCAVVPAAIAAAEEAGADDQELLCAIAKGYELCARIGTVLGGAGFITDRGFDTHAFGGVFGAAAAAASLLGLDERQAASALSLAAHQAAGLATLFRDRLHVEKAFVFAGMPARNGVWAAQAAARGLVATERALESEPGFLSAFAVAPGPISDDLGRSWAVEHTNIKRWCVGSPIQAALDCVESLAAEHGLSPGNVSRVRVRLSHSGARVVDGRDMPNVNLQHLVALMLVDGTVGFASSHDHARMIDPQILALSRRVDLSGSDELTAAEPARGAIVEIETTGGRLLVHRARHVRGAAENPMTDDEIAAKFVDLAALSLGTPEAHATAQESLAGAPLRATLRALRTVAAF